ncbi:hypothetical protein [Thermomonas fusca]|uniref:hypothetical protein n=1 Tax=Thermomonas fusca TaxID=215690 RepID=UPI00048B8BD5|nr:hypothetical protein [Thermomonas fusca]
MAKFLGIEFVNGNKRRAEIAERIESDMGHIRGIVAKWRWEVGEEERAAHLEGVEATAGVIEEMRRRLSIRNRLGHLSRDQLFKWEEELAEMGAAVESILQPLRDKKAARGAVEAVQSERGKVPAVARWERLNPVKEWAFQQRRDNPPPKSRAAVIKSILPEVRERARAEGEPLTGDDLAVTRTVTKWFRDADIK